MSRPTGANVRMRGFVERIQPEEALARLKPLVAATKDEAIPFATALGRTLAADIVKEIDVPAFAKSAMDGYGIHAEESFGAAASNPLRFRLAGEVLPGRPLGRAVRPGEAVRLMTGGPVPQGVDAVAMAEHAEERDGQVFLSEPLTPGKNVVPIGEDVRKGDIVLSRGRVLRPQDLGVMASIGALRPMVKRRPSVAIATTGNELQLPGPPGSLAAAGVVNSNTYVLEALVAELGGEAVPLGIVGDDSDSIARLVTEFDGDLLVTTGGTSVGVEDYLPVVVGEQGKLHVHGISIRPGSPSGFGQVGSRLVFLLPGNPVAAMVGFDVLVRPALQWMLGQEEGRRNPRARGRLTRKVASALNRVDFVRVRMTPQGEVEPVRSGGAGVLSSMTKADGFLIVPKDLEGYEAQSEVEVYLF